MIRTPKTAPGSAQAKPEQSRARLIGVDAARGVALIGLMAIHLLPHRNEETGDPTLAFELFSGHSAALFAFLAGVGLAFSSGGQRPHRGRKLAGDRLALAARALLIGAVALAVAVIMPPDPPAYSILLYYSVFFLLAIPFLRLGPTALFLCAAAFGIISSILLQQLDPVLPASSSTNPGLVTILTEPAGVASQLLLTGTYPALPYMCYILAGMGIGRLNLRKTSILAGIAGVGAVLAILANAISSILLYAADGYERLLVTPGMTEELLDEAIVYGPDTVPNTSVWWLALVTPHTNMPLAIAESLGLCLLVAAMFILVGRKIGRVLTPLAAPGSMTLTLYTAHLVALAPEVHWDQPYLWFIIHLVAAVVFGMLWSRWVGQGPLERVVAVAARNFRKIVDYEAAGGPAGGSKASGTPGAGPGPLKG